MEMTKMLHTFSASAAAMEQSVRRGERDPQEVLLDYAQMYSSFFESCPQMIDIWIHAAALKPEEEDSKLFQQIVRERKNGIASLLENIGNINQERAETLASALMDLLTAKMIWWKFNGGHFSLEESFRRSVEFLLLNKWQVI